MFYFIHEHFYELFGKTLKGRTDEGILEVTLSDNVFDGEIDED